MKGQWLAYPSSACLATLAQHGIPRATRGAPQCSHETKQAALPKRVSNIGQLRMVPWWNPQYRDCQVKWTMSEMLSARRFWPNPFFYVCALAGLSGAWLSAPPLRRVDKECLQSWVPKAFGLLICLLSFLFSTYSFSKNVSLKKRLGSRVPKT